MVVRGMKVEDLDTPCLIVDMDKVEHNILQWQAAIGGSGAKVRPHVKTHKVPQIAKMQLAAGACGITVAKVSEAEVFSAGGCTDIFIACPVIGPSKWRRAAELAHTCVVRVAADSEAGVRGLNEAASAAGTTLLVRVEIDSGMNRSGVSAEDAQSLCQLVMSLPGLSLDGIFTYRSVFFPGAEGRSPADLGREEGQLMVAIAERLRAAGIPITEVSLGSSPTAWFAAQVPGVTELRPGTYVFSDYMLTEMGVTTADEVALSILCTVVSRPAADKATVDGGSKTFGGDVRPADHRMQGYARALGLEAYITSLYEEHGVARLGPGVDLKVGDKVAFHPIHVCTTVNLSDELVGVRGGLVEQVWPVAARGKRV